MSGAKRRVSFEKFRAEKFYTETAPRPDDKAHFSDRYRLLAGHFGFDCGNQMRLAPAPQARTKADEKAREFDITTTSFNVCVHPGNFRKREHRWPEDNFIALTKLLLAEPDVRVFYFSGPGEDAHVIKMLKSLPAGRITLIKAMNPAVWAALMTRFDIMIVNATATMHIAAAMDVPFLGFHSGYSWRCWRPLTGLCDNINSGDWDSCRIIPVEMAHQKYAALKTQILARK
jgi:ADP-heptose:LPS heptosyltransferase